MAYIRQIERVQIELWKRTADSFFSDVFTAHDGGLSSLLKLANVGHDCIALVKGDTKDCHVFTRV